MIKETPAVHPIAVKKIQDTLVVAFSSENQITLSLRSNSPEALAVLKTTLEHIPSDVVITLDLQSIRTLSSELICSLFKRGAQGSCMSVTEGGFAALKTLRLINQSGVSQVPEKFCWHVTCQPIKECFNRQDLSDSLIRAVAAELIKPSKGMGSLCAYQRQVELAKTEVRRDFCVKEIDGVFIVKLSAPLTSELAKSIFSGFLAEHLPYDRRSCVDLSALVGLEQGLRDCLFAYCTNRQRAGGSPLELVVPAGLEGVLSPEVGGRLGFKVTYVAHERETRANES
jgi:hypothetical protein